MKSFLQRFGAIVLGVLQGFDRLRFRGSMRQLCYAAGADSYLGHVGVRLTDYGTYSQATTASLCKAVETEAKAAGIYRYLNSSDQPFGLSKTP